MQQGKVSTFTTSAQANFTIVLFPTLLAFIRKVAPVHWETIMLAMNVVCAAITGVFLVKIVREVSGSMAAAMAALLFYLGGVRRHYVGQPPADGRALHDARRDRIRACRPRNHGGTGAHLV